jgi:hypothetical protein
VLFLVVTVTIGVSARRVARHAKVRPEHGTTGS